MTAKKHHKFSAKSRNIFGAPQVPTVIKVLVGKKLVKNEMQAAIIIKSVFVLLIIATLLMLEKSIFITPAKINPQLIVNNNQ